MKNLEKSLEEFREQNLEQESTIRNLQRRKESHQSEPFKLGGPRLDWESLRKELPNEENLDADQQLDRFIQEAVESLGKAGPELWTKSSNRRRPDNGADDEGDDELQKVIQASLRAAEESRKAIPRSRIQSSNKLSNRADNEGDDELQKAIQESLRSPNKSGRHESHEPWNDETFKRILEQNKYKK